MDIKGDRQDDFLCSLCGEEIAEGDNFIETYVNNGIREETGGYVKGTREVWDRSIGYAHLSHFLSSADRKEDHGSS